VTHLTETDIDTDIDTDADPVELTRTVTERHAERADAEARFPVEALAAMRRTGLLGLLVPAGYGGGGGTLTDLVTTTVELGRADMSVAMIFAMHCQQVLALARYGGDRLRSAVLPAVAEGSVYVASVTTELGKGGHLLTSGSPVHQVGGTLLIDRRAPVVTGGAHADGFLITMAMPGATSPTQVDLLYATRDQIHLEVLGDWRPLGARATESLPMRLTGSVPDWQVVGEHGGFRSIAASLFAPLAHIGWAAAWLGAAAGAYGRVVRHIRSDKGRAQFDPSSELLLTRLADARARLDVVHALLRHTVAVVESAPDVTATPVQLLVNTLKTEAATGCFAVADALVELTGLRHGYLTDSPLWLERTFRDLRSASLNYGNDRLRLANGSLALMDTGVRLASLP
jgi:acyl-CoA dehydrogenase